MSASPFVGVALGLSIGLMAAMPPCARAERVEVDGRWSFELLPGQRFERGSGWSDHELRGVEDEEATLALSETPFTGPVDEANAAWLLDFETAPALGRDATAEGCRVRSEERVNELPRLWWVDCTSPEITVAALEHADGRLLVVSMLDPARSSMIVRSALPLASAATPVSNGLARFEPADGRPLFSAVRGPHEGFSWVAEVAPLGQSEVSILTFRSTTVERGPLPDKVAFMGRLFRANVDHAHHRLRLTLEAPGEPRRWILEGEASSEEALMRLRGLLERATLESSFSGSSTPTQPPQRKADEPLESTGVPIPCVVVAVVTALLAIGFLLNRERRR